MSLASTKHAFSFQKCASSFQENTTFGVLNNTPVAMTKMRCQNTKYAFIHHKISLLRLQNTPLVFTKTHLQRVQSTPLMFQKYFRVHKIYLTFSQTTPMRKHAFSFC